MERWGVTRLHLVESETLDFQFMRALCYQAYGGASTGEVLRVASELNKRGNTRENWIKLWTEQGEHCEKLADEAMRKGQTITARSAYLRAYNYLRAAEFYYESAEENVKEHYESADLKEHLDFYLWGVTCFDNAASLFDFPVDKIEIPYKNGVTLPGYFVSPADDGIKRPTVIICGGADGYGEESYFWGVPEALARGFNVVMFHGPGQRGVWLRHPDQVFQPDYEKPITAVVDYTVKRKEVDAELLALCGYSLGGYLAPRAAAFEPRIRALVANAPIYDFHNFMLSGVFGSLPGYAKKIAQRAIEGMPEAMWAEQEKHLAKKNWELEAAMKGYMPRFGIRNLYEEMQHLKDYTLHGLEHRITCPTLCVSAVGEGEEAVAQAHAFYNALTCPKEFYSLTVEDGADNHCGLNNIVHASSVICDWLKHVLG
jgi:pimeloyl-ACP methyl ester carboxylesterase